MILKPRLGRKPRRVKAKGIPLPVFLGLFNEGGGDIIADLSGNNNVGTAVGDPPWAGGKFGPAINFNGVDETVSIANSPTLNFGANQGFSILVHLYFLPAVGPGALIRSAGLGDRYILESRADDKFRLELLSGAGDVWIESDALGAGWVTILATRNGVTGVLKMYADGISQGTQTGPEAGSVAGAETLYIASRGGTQDWYTGLIDHVMIFDQTLNASQATELQHNRFPWFEKDPIELWVGSVGAGAPPGVVIPVMIHHYKQAGGL